MKFLEERPQAAIKRERRHREQEGEEDISVVISWHNL
jgi:hypothetical protein